MSAVCEYAFSGRVRITKIINRITTNGAFIGFGFEETTAIPILYRLDFAYHYINLLISLCGLDLQMHISLCHSNVKGLRQHEC